MQQAQPRLTPQTRAAPTVVPALVVRTQERFASSMGHDPVELFRGLAPRARMNPVPWADVAARFDRLGALGDDVPVRFASFYVETFPVVLLLAAHFVSVRRFYGAALSRWRAIWPLELVEHDGDTLVVDARQTEGPPCPTLIDILHEVLRQLPRALGASDAHVQRHDDHPTHIRFTCALPDSGPHDEMDAEQVKTLVSTYLDIRESSAPPASWKLTQREREIVVDVSRGRSLRDIAQERRIGIETVRTHVKRAMTKAGVHSQVELVSVMLGQR